jgi:hypothetical protein
MFDFATTELQAIDDVLEPKLAWAQNRQAQSEQMALDASRLLSCVDDRLGDYASQGFFRRCWFTLSGKSGEVERANAHDLVEMQKHAWRYITLLQERDLLMAHSVIAVKNNLLTLAVRQNDQRGEIMRLAGRVYDRFVALESRMDRIEVASNIHSWLLTIETRNYDEKYTPYLRLLRVVRDFHALKGDSWNADELKYLQTALRNVGLNPKQTLTLYDFVNGLVEEIEEHGFGTFAALTEIDQERRIDNGFVVDAISAPAFGALYQVKDNYTVSSRVIRALQKRLEVSHADAMKMILHDFVTDHGIDTSSSIPLQHLAVELLGCLSLARRLAVAGTEAEQCGSDADGGEAVRPIGQPDGQVDALTDDGRIQKEQSEHYQQIIIKCLSEYQDGDFYIRDNIPTSKVKAARRAFPIDYRVKIFGLIDTTLFGGCDEGMAICDNGVYWNNIASKSGEKFASWGDLIANKQFIHVIENKVCFSPGNYFLPQGCKLSAKFVARMITDLVERLEAR